MAVGQAEIVTRGGMVKFSLARTVRSTKKISP